MAAGYLLALFPTVLILIGAAVACKRLVCRPDPSWFVLLGVGFSTLAAILLMSVKLPFYAQVKSFYGLIAVLPVCAVAVRGWELVQQCWKPVVVGAATLFGVWSMNSYASFWIARWDSTAQLATAHGLTNDHFQADADQHYAEALRLAPANIDARTHVAARLFLKNQLAPAIQMMHSVLQDAPGDSESHFLMSLLLMGQDGLEPAIAEARRAIILAPDYPAPFPHLCTLLVKAGRNQEAFAVGTEGLRSDALDPEMHTAMGSVFSKLGDKANATVQFRLAAQLRPQDPAFHIRLAMALTTMGRTPEAVTEYHRALTWDPNSVTALNNLAWILATTPDSQLRNGEEATRLAARACELTRDKTPLLVGTLAAAYAEAGRFAEAVTAAEQARNLARAAGQQSIAEKNQQLIDLFKTKKAYREKQDDDPHP
jgi:Flp pilus assembly protein TadD